MKFSVAMAQLAPKLGNFSDNVEAHLRWVEKARSAGANLVVFPELSLTGYILQDLVPEIAVPLPHATRLQPLLDACRGIDCVFGFVEVSSNFNYYNAAAYVSDGKILHVHRKLYLPTYGMFDEMRFFAMGENLRTFQTQFGELGLLICEDLWHPSTDRSACPGRRQGGDHDPRAGPGRGVREGQLFATSQGWGKPSQDHVPVPHGVQHRRQPGAPKDGAHFPGGSMVVGPSGEVVAQAKYFEEDFVVAALDIEEVRRARLFTPVLRDERLELTLRELSPIAAKRNEPH